MIRSAWRMWKRFRWKNLVRVWAVFMAIALVLLAQTLGIHYGATKFTLKYMARNEAIPAQNAIMGQRATNLMLVDSSQDGVDEAEAICGHVKRRGQCEEAIARLRLRCRLPVIRGWSLAVLRGLSILRGLSVLRSLVVLRLRCLAVLRSLTILRCLVVVRGGVLGRLRLPVIRRAVLRCRLAVVRGRSLAILRCRLRHLRIVLVGVRH